MKTKNPITLSGAGVDVDAIASLAQQATREPVITLTDGSDRQYLYDDTAKKYEPVKAAGTLPRAGRTVGDILSLVDLVLAEKDRMERECTIPETSQPTHSSDGLFVTAAFTNAGGKVFLREERGKKSPEIAFVRQASFALKTVQGALGQWRSHEDFLVTIANLGPWLKDSKAVLNAFRKISAETTQGMVSQPFLNEEGNLGDRYSFELKVRGSTMEASLPATLHVDLPVTARAPKTYALELWIDIGGQQKEGGAFVPKFRLIAPELASVLETAIEEELKLFRERTLEALPKLVIVRES